MIIFSYKLKISYRFIPQNVRLRRAKMYRIPCHQLRNYVFRLELHSMKSIKCFTTERSETHNIASIAAPFVERYVVSAQQSLRWGIRCAVWHFAPFVGYAVCHHTRLDPAARNLEPRRYVVVDMNTGKGKR